MSWLPPEPAEDTLSTALDLDTGSAGLGITVSPAHLRVVTPTIISSALIFHDIFPILVSSFIIYVLVI